MQGAALFCFNLSVLCSCVILLLLGCCCCCLFVCLGFRFVCCLEGACCFVVLFLCLLRGGGGGSSSSSVFFFSFVCYQLMLQYFRKRTTSLDIALTFHRVEEMEAWKEELGLDNLP